MKKIIGISLAVSLVAGFAYSGMRTDVTTNPNGLGYGLPAGWTLVPAKGYDDANITVTGNPGSAMCVECHTVNPSSRILTPSNNGDYTEAFLLGNNSRGTHFVQNYVSVLNSYPATNVGAIATTNTGGGFSGGFNTGAQPRTAGGQYEKIAAWTASGGVSKYQDKTVTVLDSNFGLIAADRGGMICESCHNLNNNMGANLALDNYTNNGNSDICIGCHSAMHTQGNLAAFDGNTTTPKRHHVLANAYGTTVDQLINDAAHYNGGGKLSRMWAPSATDRLDLTWCAGQTPGPYGDVPSPSIVLDIAAGANVAYRNACNVAGQGTYLFSDIDTDTSIGGDIAPSAANSITCANCHRPHNAMTGAGAFIFRSGVSAATGRDFTTTPLVTTYNLGNSLNTTQTSYDLVGLRRQYDVGDFTSVKIYSEYVNLCKGCHRGY